MLAMNSTKQQIKTPISYIGYSKLLAYSLGPLRDSPINSPKGVLCNNLMIRELFYGSLRDFRRIALKEIGCIPVIKHNVL